MIRKLTIHGLAMLLVTGAVMAQSDVERDVRKTILDSVAWTNANKKDNPSDYSKEGALEFWSSGGLLHKVSPGGAGAPGGFDAVNLAAVHIEVIPLPGGQSAAAMYYLEGSLQPKGGAPVPHYLTRVTQVFAKEDGKWKIRASHWSEVKGGSGTTQTGAID